MFLQRGKITFIQKPRYAISCVVNFCNAGVVTRDRVIWLLDTIVTIYNLQFTTETPALYVVPT
jgi:hypothetical protein